MQYCGCKAWEGWSTPHSINHSSRWASSWCNQPDHPTMTTYLCSNRRRTVGGSSFTHSASPLFTYLHMPKPIQGYQITGTATNRALGLLSTSSCACATDANPSSSQYHSSYHWSLRLSQKHSSSPAVDSIMHDSYTCRKHMPAMPACVEGQNFWAFIE
jgi:hypothetical protein